MRYTEIKKGRYEGYWENEDGVIYTADVAKTRMENQAAYDPPVAPVAEKKSSKKKSAKK